MKAVCSGLNLSEAVSKVVKACASKSPIPVMECIKISAQNDALVLSATDGEISITKKIEAEVMDEGEFCVPGRYFADIVRKLEDLDLTLTASENMLTITYGPNRVDLQILPPDDFPEIKTEINEGNFVIKSEILKKIIKGVTFCCAQDESRPILKGVQIVIKDNQASFTAIDGFRLATYTVTLESSTGDCEIVCPARTLNEIEKLLPSEGETTVYSQANYVLVCVDDTIITSRLFTGDFIQKENIIPKSYETTVTCKKADLDRALNVGEYIAREDKNCIIVFSIADGKIVITSRSDKGNAENYAVCDIEGKDLRIAMNARYIMNAVSAIDKEVIELKFNNEVQPFICRDAEKKDGLYLILPVRYK